MKVTNESPNQEAENSGMSFVTDVEDLLQIAEVDVYFSDRFEQVDVLCGSS